MALKNTKAFAIVGFAVVVILVIVVAVVFTSDIGDTGNTSALSGRYVAINSDNAYLEFSGENKVEMNSGSGITFHGTYTLDGNQLNIEWDMSPFGATGTSPGHGTISDDKQEIVLDGGARLTKR